MTAEQGWDIWITYERIGTGRVARAALARHVLSLWWGTQANKQRRPLSGHLDLSRRPIGTQVGVGRGMNRPCTFFVVGGMNRVPFSWVAWWPPVQLQEIFFLWFPPKKKIFFLWCMPSLLQPYLICTRRNMFKQAIEYQSSLFCSTTSKTLQFPIFCI